MERQSPASTDLVPLDAFVGVWETQGEIKAGPSGQAVSFKASDTYEWLPGGHFLLHRFNADMPEGTVSGIEVIGYSQVNKSYHMHSFDSLGNVIVMNARVEKDTWTFTGESMRFTGSFQENGMVFAGLWELRSGDESTWHPWMNIRLRKVA
jgi:hypothetical protein